MKKEYIDKPDVTDFIKAMNNEENLHCETLSGTSCIISKTHCAPGIPGSAMVSIDYIINDNPKQYSAMTDKFRLYRRIFENGDYVRQQSGVLLICAGVTDNGKYLFHAALSKDGELQFPDEFYTYGKVMYDDRLCTAEEEMVLNGTLMKEDKIFDPITQKINNSVFKRDKEHFLEFWKRFNPFKNKEDLKHINDVNLPHVITISEKTGEVVIPSSLTPEHLKNVIVKCADVLKVKTESVPMFP